MTRDVADIILFNGKIVTVDPNDRIVNAVAIKNGRFIVVGSDRESMTFRGDNTKVIDLGGRMAMPGIIDSHTHPSSIATRMLEVDCREPRINKIEDILDLISDEAEDLEAGKWVRGANFNDSKLEERRHVTRWELDEVAPENPVYITSDTGHQSIVNSLALEIAGIDEDTPDPPGGKIDRNEDGVATGLLYENASDLVREVVPKYSVEELKGALRRVFEKFSEWGVTSTHDASGYCTSVRAYKRLLDEGIKRVRISLMMSVEPQQPDRSNLLRSMRELGVESGFGNDWLKFMSLKIMGDGSGAGGTAAVYTPQNRGTKDLGIMITDKKEMEGMVIKAHNADIRCSIHSIGDRGIDIALDCIEKAQSLNPKPDMRHRLEHNSCCTPKQLNRIKELGVTPSSSIGYMYGLGDQYAENFGAERSRWLHPHRTMKEMGIIAGGNSDCPVTYYNPFFQIYAAVTRKTDSDQIVGHEEAISVMDAIKLYTWNGAYLSKDEDKLGSIETDKYADLIVLDRDILEMPYDQIPEANVLMTIVDGQIVYDDLN